MAKRNSNSIIILLFLCLLLNTFTLILSESIPVEYDPKEGIGIKDVDSAQTISNYYYLNFPSSAEKPNYVRVTLTPKKGQNTPYLCYSPSDENCVKDRRVYATRADKTPVFACVKKTEISGANKINIKVDCKTKNCGFILKFEKAESCQLNADTGTVYTFVASIDNDLTKYEIKGTTVTQTFIYIGLEGSSKGKINISPNPITPREATYENAYFLAYQVNAQLNETDSIGNFTIDGTVSGELIRLSVYTVQYSKAPNNLLYPGGPAVMGFVFENEVSSSPQLCFPISALASDELKDISKFYITGKIYSQYGLFWPSDEYGEYIEDLEQDIDDGLLAFVHEPKGKRSSMCFEYPEIKQLEKKDVVFSVQIVPMATKSTSNFYFVHPPMMLGQTYRHIIQKGKTLAYSPAKINKDSRYSFNVFRRKGVARVYAIDCDDYPNCEYSMEEGDEKWLDKAELVSNIGKISLYDRKMKETQEALAQKKKVFIITCLDDGNDGAGYCELDTSFHYTNQTITLVSGETMAKFVPKGQQGQFKMFFNGYFKLESVAVEIMIHNGEILFDGLLSENGETNEFATVTKYILSNKVFLNYQLYRDPFQYLYVKYRAIKDSYFTIKYIYNKAGTTAKFLNETIFPGESYLVEMPPNVDEYKKVHVMNDKNKDGNSFLTNFFALNCDFKVTAIRDQGKEEEIAIADGYGQDILSRDNGTIYKSDYYNYTITVEKPEQSNYNDKMCMMYVAGAKVEDMILISNNVNQQIIFNYNFKVIKFLYPIPNPGNNKDLIVYANIIDKAYYKISIAVDSETHTFVEEQITKSTPFYIENAQFKQHCNSDTFCNIVIIVELEKYIEYLPKTNPMIEITVREPTLRRDVEKLRVPSYLQKGIAKKDFTTGDGYYYLYTDLGASDEGDVTINFYRDYGEVYGRIVKKNTKDTSEGIEWMDLYRLPGYGWGVGVDDKNYNRYLKKYHIDIEDTADCINGCYLILGVIISQIGEYSKDWKFYPFSIITQIGQSTFGEDADVPIITIQVDEFIIGNVNIAKNVRISQFYQVWLPHDTYQVQLDWQSELAGLYINVDDNLPSAENADFIRRPNGTDSILVLDKQQILDVLVEKKKKSRTDNSLEDVRLIIGVWTDKSDSANTELYSLRVHEAGVDPREYTFFDIIEVNTDQKILCKPYIIGENRYQCLFMIMYDRQDVEFQQDLLVYARSNNKADSTEMYGVFINANIYDEYNVDELRKNVPTYDSSYFNSVKDDTNYFYAKFSSEKHNNSYLYVSVISKYPDDIMMVSSINVYDIQKEQSNSLYFYNPSPRTEQLAQIIDSDTLRIKFMIKASLIINIENLGGEADLRWEKDDTIVHNLRGRGDRLTLTTPSDKYEILIFTKIKSDAQQKGKDPGFVFLIDYYERNPSKNFDEVVYGSSIEIGYRETDLPLFLYSKAVDYSNDISLALTFRDSHIDTSGEYTESPIVVKAYLDKRDTIYSAKQLPSFEPSETNKMDGFYDPAIKTATVFIPDFIINYLMRIEPEDYPTLLLYIGKSPAYKDKKYQTFNAEAQFTRINSLVIPIQKLYNYAKLEGTKTHYYKLKTHKVKKIMKVVLSFNSWELSWSISLQQSDHKNTTSYNIATRIRNGKITATITPTGEASDFIYLNIWKTNPGVDEHFELQNYAFKYINVEKEEEFFDFEIYGNKAELTKNENPEGGNTTIECTFNRINVAEKEANITYFLKIADAKNYINRENFETVAVTESPYYTKYERNPIHPNNKVTLIATGDFGNWCCIQVIAQIQKGKALEYVAYKPITTQRESPTDKKQGEGQPSNTGLFIGISIGLVIVIVGLVAVVVYFQKRNQSLVNQVKHVSFQNNSSVATDPDLLLAKK